MHAVEFPVSYIYGNAHIVIFLFLLPIFKTDGKCEARFDFDPMGVSITEILFVGKPVP